MKDKRKQLLEKLETATKAGTPSSQRELQSGDRVRIINKVKRPAQTKADWTWGKERLATIRHLEGDRVVLTTDNGTKTWRLRKYVQQL